MKTVKQTRTVEESFVHGFSEADLARGRQLIKVAPRRRRRRATATIQEPTASMAVPAIVGGRLEYPAPPAPPAPAATKPDDGQPRLQYHWINGIRCPVLTRRRIV